MSWWFAIPAVVSGISTISQASQASAQNRSQYAINQYNAQMQYSTQQQNSANMMAIAGMNFAAASGAAQLNLMMSQYNAQLIRQSTDYNRRLLRASTDFNVNTIQATTTYNNSLLEGELEDLWEAADLDLELLANQRARERGEIIAIQAGSGTVIGEGSNADVVIDQKAQEALDALVVRHNADKEAANIRREQSKNLFQGHLAIMNTLWEGNIQDRKMQMEANLGVASTLISGLAQYGSTMMQAGAQYAGTALQSQANLYNAQQAYQADIYGAQTQYRQNKTQIRSNMLTGLFGAVGSGVSGYFQQKVLTTPPPTSQLGASYPGGGRTAEGYSYMRGPTLTDPGGSLIGTSGR